MVDIVALENKNAERWSKIELLRKSEFSSVARRLVSSGAKRRYLKVSERTGVPWYVIAVIHERESSQDWSKNLAQGDAWNRISIHVPRGRGPFNSWEDAAVDALVNCAPYAARHHDWSIGPLLTILEEYNGLGYASRGQPSPYIWSGTNQYKSGKYVRDGVFDASVVDRQLGCAGLLFCMAELDQSIQLGEVQVPVPTTPVPVPQFGLWGWLVWLFEAILSVFRRK